MPTKGMNWIQYHQPDRLVSCNLRTEVRDARDDDQQQQDDTDDHDDRAEGVAGRQPRCRGGSPTRSRSSEQQNSWNHQYWERDERPSNEA